MVNLCRVVMAAGAGAAKYSVRVLPAGVRGMTAFDEGSFARSIQVRSLMS